MSRRLARALALAGALACGRTGLVDFDPPVLLVDAGLPDGGDGGRRDAGFDAGVDGGRPDGGARDGGATDGGLDAGPEPGTAADDLVYLHDDATLFVYLPATNVVSRVGPLTCVRPTDLAIDRAGRAFMVAGSSLYRLNLQTGVCTQFATLPEPLVTLQFLPAGIVDALDEGLVGYGTQTYWQFELRNGMALALGSSALGMGLSPSGDLTALEDGGAFLTVRGGLCGDCLVRIDPQTGAVLERLGPVGASAVWGLATFDDALLGFTASGAVLRLELLDGGVRSQVLLSAPGRSFWGAAAKPGARSRRDGG